MDALIDALIDALFGALSDALICAWGRRENLSQRKLRRGRGRRSKVWEVSVRRGQFCGRRLRFCIRSRLQAS